MRRRLRALAAILDRADLDMVCLQGLVARRRLALVRRIAATFPPCGLRAPDSGRLREASRGRGLHGPRDDPEPARTRILQSARAVLLTGTC